jgi:hypothetical protein
MAAPRKTRFSTVIVGGGIVCPSVLTSANVIKKLVGNLKTEWRSVVIGADEHHTRLAMVRQIIGKRADGLADLVRGVAAPGPFALASIRLKIAQQHLKSLVAQNCHPVTVPQTCRIDILPSQVTAYYPFDRKLSRR